MQHAKTAWTSPETDPLDLSRIQPVVLAGGASERFGRDKLREPITAGPLIHSSARPAAPPTPARWLIDAPIAALRALFGRRVALVGACDESLRARADLWWPDDAPPAPADPRARRGPSAGLLTALTRSNLDVFLLAGDLPNITARAVARILHAADSVAPDPAFEPWAILARSAGADHVEPCIGLYRRAMLPILRARLSATSPLLSLHDAAPSSRLLVVDLDPRETANVNRPEDLAPGRAAPPAAPDTPA